MTLDFLHLLLRQIIGGSQWKTIIPFNTKWGYGVGSGFQMVKELCPDSKVLEGFEIKGGEEGDGVYFVIKDEKAKEAEIKVKSWLQKIKVAKEVKIQQ